MKMRKLLGWLVILGILAWVGYSLMLGQSSDSPTGNVVMTDDGRQATVLKFPECMDTDDGKNYDVQGHTYNTRDNIIRDDYCEDENTVVEFFCNNQYPDRIMVSCDCFKGACRDSPI